MSTPTPWVLLREDTPEKRPVYVRPDLVAAVLPTASLSPETAIVVLAGGATVRVAGHPHEVWQLVSGGA